ncbi:hypothetical protein [Pseudomonas sp. Pseu.R1]|uniref:hypothetical protein n=1 Tax=Pseudomonas sp. Pseu.R1 TaxID=3379818 RepID=UPI003B92A699
MSIDKSKPSDDLSPKAPAVDASGKPVDVVKRDIADEEKQTRAVDEIVTPSSIRTKEQDVEKLDRAADASERKVDDSAHTDARSTGDR